MYYRKSVCAQIQVFQQKILFLATSNTIYYYFCDFPKPHQNILQEPKTDKDDENCRRINDVMNNPPAPGSNRSGGTTPG